MRIFVAIFLFITALTGCDNREKYSDENGFKFFDARLQKQFIDSLKKEGIPFRLREDGTVLYSPKDDGRVGKARISMLEESFVPSIHYEDESDEKLFMEQLKSAGVAFAIEVRDGKRWITWSKQDDERVSRLRSIP
jgi:hypothetical protein